MVPRASIRAVGCAFLLLFAWSCGGQDLQPPAYPSESRVIPGVPFFPQERYQCGPASLAGAMGYYGVRVTPREVARQVFRPDLRGTLGLDLALYARERGLQARWYSGDTSDLLDSLESGQPLILMVDRGWGPVKRPHFLVAKGYSPRGLVANSGREEGKTLPWKSFVEEWRRAGHWTLRLSPGERGRMP